MSTHWSREDTGPSRLHHGSVVMSGVPCTATVDWMLACTLPLGVEIGRRGGTATFGLVPEYTFAVADDATAEFETGLGRVLAFDRRWAVFLTVSGALTL